MKKLLSFVGCAAAAVVSGTVVYLYLNDKEVHEKVDTAVASVGAAIREVKHSFELNRMAKEEEKVSPLERNQAWTDEQWEALGI